jgi:hypothetical protein
VVVVGDGGKYVEALKDFALLVTPFDADEVKEALQRLATSRPLLDGVRGDPPLDLDALAAAAIGVGRLIAASKGRIASIDLNPVMVGAKGEGVVIVDALVERATVTPAKCEAGGPISRDEIPTKASPSSISSQGVAGPGCGAFFRAERRRRDQGRAARGRLDPRDGRRREGLTANAIVGNLGKRSICIDARKPEGRALVLRWRPRPTC